jgi:hypothetical protein
VVSACKRKEEQHQAGVINLNAQNPIETPQQQQEGPSDQPGTKKPRLVFNEQQRSILQVFY